MSRRRPVINRTNYELAAPIAGHGAELFELYRRFQAEEERLSETLGPDDPPTFADFVAWIVERGSRPPHRPRGQRDRHPDANLRRSRAQQRRRATERQIARSAPSRVAA